MSLTCKRTDLEDYKEITDVNELTPLIASLKNALDIYTVIEFRRDGYYNIKGAPFIDPTTKLNISKGQQILFKEEYEITRA